MKFLVFQNGKPAQEFSLSAAYMFGADLIPLHQVQIEYQGGVIECTKRSPDSAGLALLWSVEGVGRFLLPTTRLPEHAEPYNLNVELARARLMQITLKREDWALFEEENGFADMAHEAQDLFIQALQHISHPEKAAELADQSLQKGIIFSERLAQKHAEQFLAVRCKHRGLGRHSLGCTVDLSRMKDELYRKRLFDMFGFVTLPIRWADMEKEHGHYDFGAIDRCIETLAGKRLALCMGPLLCFTPSMVPQWLLAEKPAFEKIREAAYEFVSQMVARYSRYVHSWRVISGMNALNCFGFTFEQIIEMTRTACLAAKGADSKSRKVVEIMSPWGEYYAVDRTTIPPLVYADMVIQSGINFDAFGLSLAFGGSEPGMHVRDMMQISSRLDCLAPVSKPVHITSLAVPDRVEAGVNDPAMTGYWRKPWTPEVQAEWMEQVYKAALGRPFINTVTYGQLADGPGSPVPGAGLVDASLNPKKAMMVVAKFQKLILKR